MLSRWGKKYVDNRDWKTYNQKLVDRGSFILDQRILEKWKTSLDRMNNGKYGRHYEFPDELIYWAALQHIILNMPYRQITGFLETYFKDTGLEVPHYSTLYKRIKAMKFEVEAVVKKKTDCCPRFV